MDSKNEKNNECSESDKSVLNIIVRAAVSIRNRSISKAEILPVGEKDPLEQVRSSRHAWRSHAAKFDEIKPEDREAADEVVEKKWGSEEEVTLEFSQKWIFGVILFLLGGLICVNFLSQGSKRGSIAEQGGNILGEKNHVLISSEGIPESFISKDDLKKAEAVYADLLLKMKGFLAQKTVEDRLSFVRHQQRVRPLMEEYYQKHPIDVFDMKDIGAFELSTIGDRTFWVTEAVSGDVRIPILIEHTLDGQLLIDWETMVCYQHHDWEKLIADRPEGEYVMRLRVHKADLNIYEYSDAERWLSVRLGTKGSELEIFGYIHHKTEKVHVISEMFKSMKTDEWASLIVKMRFPKDGRAKNVCEIIEILSYNWVYGDDPSIPESGAN